MDHLDEQFQPVETPAEELPRRCCVFCKLMCNDEEHFAVVDCIEFFPARRRTAVAMHRECVRREMIH